LELILAGAYVFAAKKPKKILLATLAGNVITLPIVYFLIPLIFTHYILYILVAEPFAVLFEAAIYRIMVPEAFTTAKALLFSLILNAASFLSGIMAFMALAIFFLIII
jgi:hypothetical protein